ncbi:TVP38/TMEM64 family protein [Pilimelia columellifera]|uniref:TVP38/TMEM64 family membrane protein n=1 Tax=Pilimelia columellifera subsp. columellifera TaxID=706583 RepID=A0ABN3NA14_9ACTN
MPTTPIRRSPLRRLILLVAAVAALAAAATQLPLQTLQHDVIALGPAAPVAVIVAGALLVAVMMPRTAVSFACGALFGAAAGFGYAIVAAIVAATVTYLLGRWAGRGFIAARSGGRMDRIDSWIARRGVLAVVVTRLLPLAPYGLIGYAYGASTVRARHYFIGTLLGAAPSAFSYATIGAAVVSPGSMSPVTFIPVAIGMSVSSLAAWHWRRQATAGRGNPAATPAGPEQGVTASVIADATPAPRAAGRLEPGRPGLSTVAAPVAA